MTPFQLKIVTPDGIAFEGAVEELIVRTTSGDIGILAGHSNCVAPLGMGRAMILADGQKRYAACIGGMLSVMGGQVNLVPTTFEWAEDIDAQRAQKAVQRAKDILADKSKSDTDLRIAEAKLKRALLRSSIAATHNQR